MTKRAAIYARVSTDEQAQNTSLDGQEASCRRYAAVCGFDVYQVYRDDYTGSRIDRPELQAMLSAMREGQFQAVIVNEVSRWGRDERVLLDLKYELKGADVEFHIAQFGRVDFNNPQHNFFYSSMGSFAVMWKDIIVMNFVNGKMAKAQDRKKPVMIGNPPYGYRKEGMRKDARYVIDPLESDIVRSIFQWYTQGDETGKTLSLRGICFRLEEMGVLTPHARSFVAEHWRATTIRGILQNSMYMGITHYGKTMMKKKKDSQTEKIRVDKPKAAWIVIPVPELKIIDEYTFQLAQERLKKNVTLSRRNQHNQYLLTGYFRCGSCGASMTGVNCQGRDNKFLSYRCARFSHKPSGDSCPSENKSISARKTEEAVWNWLVSLWSDEEAFQEGLIGIRAQKKAELEPKLQRLARVRQIIQDQTNRANNLISQLAGASPALAAGIKEMAEKELRLKQEYETEARQLEFETTGIEFTPEQEENLRIIIGRIRDGIAHPSYEVKRRIFDWVNLQVKFFIDEHGRRLEVRCGLSPDVITLPLS